MARSPSARSVWIGTLAAVVLVAVAILLPLALHWNVYPRKDDLAFAPLHGYVEVKVGPGTAPAVLLAVLSVIWAGRLAQRLPWRGLLATSYAAGLGWLFSLALVDGTSGLSRALGNKHEYLRTARAVTDLPATLHEFTSRIPYAADDNWVTHIAGHPPGALVFFVTLVRLGLGGDLAAGVVVTIIAGTIPVAVLVALRALGVEDAGRRVAPFLVLSPAAVFLAVSADAVFAAVAAWGLAALALGVSAPSRGRPALALLAWSALAGLLLGCCVLLSYGLPLLGVLAVAVLVAANDRRSGLWSLAVSVVAALVPVLVMAALGFRWWDAYPVLVERYDDGIARDRPQSYWWWGNLAALVVCAGPLVGGGLARAVAVVRQRLPEHRTVLLLAGAAVLMIVLADASGMSKAEVERIWLPFVPWLTLPLALLPDRWQRPALAGQVLWALAVQHLLYTSW